MVVRHGSSGSPDEFSGGSFGVGPDGSPVKSLDALLDDLQRGQRAEHVGSPSNAHFESPSNLLATESLRFDAKHNPHSKLFLGTLGGRVATGAPLPDGRTNRWIEGGTGLGVGDDRAHVLVAGSRAGKGRSAIIPVLLTLPAQTSALVIDPKGDLARITAPWHASLHKTGVMDPFGCSGEKTKQFRCVYNPIQALAATEQRYFVANMRMIADALVITGESRDRHWDETSKQMVAGLCGHVATHRNYHGRRDLLSVWQLSTELATPDPNNPNAYTIEQEMVDNDAAGGAIRAAARTFYDRSGGEFSSVLSNLRKHLDWLSYSCMRDVLVGESIDLRDLKRDLRTLYVTLPAMRMDAMRGWMRLVVQMTLAAFEQEQTLVGNPCVMILDEFHALGRLKVLETAAAQIAGYHAKLYLSLQNLSQLHPYGKNYETFLANAGTIQVLGCADETTLEYVSKRLGQSMVLSRSTNAPTFEQAAHQAATGESWTLSNHPLMTAEEVGRYFARDDKKLRQLVLRPGYRPMILQRAFYDKHELFRHRASGK